MKQLGIIGLGAMGAPMAGKLQECGFHISHFDTELNIISATFGNGKRLTNGRFDIHYTTQQQ